MVGLRALRSEDQPYREKGVLESGSGLFLWEPAKGVSKACRCFALSGYC